MTTFCPEPTATGVERAAAMGKGSATFRKAAQAGDVAKGGIRAMTKGKVLSCYGRYTKGMSFLCRIVPRSVARKCAAKMKIDDNKARLSRCRRRRGGVINAPEP